MNVKTNVRAYLTPCIREVICTPRKSVMTTSLLVRDMQHEGFEYEDEEWGDLEYGNE